MLWYLRAVRAVARVIWVEYLLGWNQRPAFERTWPFFSWRIGALWRLVLNCREA